MENKYRDAHRFANRWDFGICEQDQHYENKCAAMYCRVHTSCIKDNYVCLQDGGWSPWSSWSSCSPRQVESINNHHSHMDANQPACPSGNPRCSCCPLLVAARCSYHYPQVHSPPPPHLHRPTSITWRLLLQRSRPGWRRNDLLSWFWF